MFDDFSRSLFAFLKGVFAYQEQPAALPAAGQGNTHRRIGRSGTLPALRFAGDRDDNLGGRWQTVSTLTAPTLRRSGSVRVRIPRSQPEGSKDTRGITPQPSSAVGVRSVVGARSISFASAQARKLTHCAAPPLPLASASLGRERGPKTTGSSSPHAVFVLTEAQLKKRDRDRNSVP